MKIKTTHWLCKLGIHKWKKKTAPDFYDPDAQQRMVYKDCERCWV